MRKQAGFTLVELLMTLTIAAILLALATPSMAEFFRTNRITSASNELVLGLQLARAEAARRGRDVSICRSADGAACSAGAWSAGWIVFQDPAGSGAPDPSGAGSQMIRVFEGLDASLTLNAPANFLRFQPDGSIEWVGVAAGTVERQFDLRVANCRGKQRRQISVTRLGRVRSAPLGCGA